jgi:threonine dehydrogenase-like Zn-dependent dehydrogenase
MNALRFENGTVSLAEAPIPRREDEALVRVTMAGICNTDLEIVRGYAEYSGTLGHEFVGVVERSPDPAQIGRRVVGEINAGCGACEGCRKGDPRHCPRRTVLGIRGREGAFAEFLSLPPRNLRFVPDNVPDRDAVFAEPLAAACEILDQVAIAPRDRVAVLGDGKLGQLIARVLHTTGCELTLIGKHAAKLELAARDGVQTRRREDVSRAPEDRYDVVVEATGSPAGLPFALDLVRARGTLVLKSTFQDNVSFNPSRIVVDEIHVLGSRCGRFEAALALLEAGRVRLAPLIAGEYPLAEGVAAMDAAARPGALKILLRTG